MALKDILVHVDATPAADARLKIAAQLADRHGAHLTGLHVKPDLILPMVEDYSGLPESYIEDFAARVDAAADEAESKFNAAVKAVNVASEWRLSRGFASDALRRQARYADLVVVGQRNPDVTDDSPPDVPDNMLLDTGRPTLVIPYVGPGASFAKHVMIAWDDGAPATRAVHDAIPLLKDADNVQIIAVNPRDTGDHGAIPGADISLHLARHGIKAEAQSVQANDDLFVMGAYGHSRWRELVLGGVTRHMLENMTMSVLMSH